MEQLTFTEAEAKLSADFFNFVFTNAHWSLTSKQVIELSRMFAGYGALQKKIDSYVLEVVKPSTPTKKDKK